MIVFVLRQARRDSHGSDFLYTMQHPEESGPRKPRVVSTRIAFTPSGSRSDAAGREPDATDETPVYVNHSSVLEVHALRDGSAVEGEGNEGAAVAGDGAESEGRPAK
ncbi:hypothetical protein GFD17_09845 [Bifidobacterium sp. SMB2]|uniref:Uncharacterized protein n=1 Tax=Bifidobacterium saimiriisciurei TaxID=2661627 RepID=A0ABX0CEE2_9BIFI|nr:MULTISPECIES: hypothetical protein [Bifidobacterium]NEG97049.1 hypothetical protein [Bifidobacterium sp. SMB2]NEH12175.1 hypothetical protein [Bifidobacterium saimiriisciurei]